MKDTPILPGATIGILGSGQLGRMLALAARRMGYRVHVYSPETNSPTGQIADREVAAAYDDLDAVRDFARRVDVVTYEFENVPAATAAAIAELVPVRPHSLALDVSQNRIREKAFCVDNRLPVTRHAPVTSESDLETALAITGLPAILKTAASGYDGKGQVRLERAGEALPAWKELGGVDAMLEAEVDFAGEVSVVCARTVAGEFAHYGLLANDHANHILDVSVAPAPVATGVAQTAIDIARTIVDQLGYVGVLCVEFFLTTDNQLLVNEIAPRPHNSGHLTIEACVTSQFEQQLRAVCGLGLGDTSFVRPAAMANVLGDVWLGGEPNWAALDGYPDVKLHLYGKAEARPGRKMGHLTCLAEDGQTAASRVRAARQSLRRA